MSAEPVDYAAEFKNEPLTLAQILDGHHVEAEGLHVFTLGEDGDEGALIPFEPPGPGRPLGSGDLTDERLARAYAAAIDGDWSEHLDCWSEQWVVLTPHVEDCRDDLGPDEPCGCLDDQYGFEWYAHKVEPATPGALRVMWWSA